MNPAKKVYMAFDRFVYIPSTLTLDANGYDTWKKDPVMQLAYTKHLLARAELRLSLLEDAESERLGEPK